MTHPNVSELLFDLDIHKVPQDLVHHGWHREKQEEEKLQGKRWEKISKKEKKKNETIK